MAQYAREWIIGIKDITDFVHEQRQYAQEHAYEQLIIPREQVYPVADTAIALRLGLDTP